MKRIWLLALACSGAAVWLLPQAGQVLDRAAASYLEDAVPARKVAVIEAALVRVGGSVRLHVTVDARGPEVDAVPGFEGVRGGNLRTCEELHRLLRDGGLRVVTRSGGVERAGTFAAGARGTLPARALRPDGSIDFAARTAAVLPTTVVAISAALGEGEHHTYFVVDDVPRLCVTTLVRAGNGRIVAIESLADPAAVRRGLVRAAVAVLVFATAAAQQPVEPFVFPADWKERDLEGRWLAYRRDRDRNAADAERSKLWAQALREREDYEFLEWIAVHEGFGDAGKALVEADAPQWMRTAHWNMVNLDSHSLDLAKKAMLRAAGRTRGWFEKFPVAKPGRGATMFKELQRYEPEDPGNQLPPLDGVMLFLPYLDGGMVAEFGDRKTAEKGVRYVHQVVRALGSLTVWGEIEPPHVGKVVRLMRHEHPEVVAAATKVLTKLPGHLLPLDDLWRMAQEGDAAAKQRALLVFSYGTHPRVFFALHRTAAGSDVALREVALRRLAEVGSPFTVWWFGQTAVPEYAPEAMTQRALWESLRTEVIAAIKKRPDFPADPAEMQRWLEREAWCRRNPERLGALYAEWLQGLAAGERAGELRRSAALLDGPVPQSRYFGAEAEAIATAVRLRVKELLGATGGR